MKALVYKKTILQTGIIYVLDYSMIWWFKSENGIKYEIDFSEWLSIPHFSYTCT